MNIQTRESLKSLACHVLDLVLMDGSTRRRFAHSTVHGKQCPIKNVILPQYSKRSLWVVALPFSTTMTCSRTPSTPSSLERAIIVRTTSQVILPSP